MRGMPWRIPIVHSVKVAQHGHAAAPAEVLDAALAEAKHALELDPLESRCHRILSTICLYRREYDKAEQHIRRAFDLNPNDADGNDHEGPRAGLRGQAGRGTRLDGGCRSPQPATPRWYDLIFGIALYSLRRFAEAAQAFKQMPLPTSWSCARLAACYAQLGGPQRHRQRSRRSCGLQPDFSTAEYMRKSVLLEHAEDRELLREGLIKAGLPA